MSTVAILVRNTIVKITNPFLQCAHCTIYMYFLFHLWSSL